MKLFLFHDEVALRWTPFIETRPVGEMLYGTMLLRERSTRAIATAAVGYLGAPHLTGFDEPGSPAQLAAPDVPEQDRIFLCVRTVLEPSGARLPDGPATIYVEGRVAGWVAPAGAPAPSAHQMSRLEAGSGAKYELPGRMLDRPWHLMATNAGRIAADLEAATPESASSPAGVLVLGDHRVVLGARSVVEPGVVLDARTGPIWLDEDTRIEGPARVIGPLFLGRGSMVLGGVVGTSSIGPICKVRGEVADSVFFGYSNKAHDGHIGHAVLGRWVNLGAGTTNSDLKNTYSSIRLRLPEGDVDTGLLKCGSFLGDHVKTGIGTLLNTGTVLGAASNVFGGRMPPLYVPPFSWGEGDDLSEYRVDKFLATAEAAMKRRGVELSEGTRDVLSGAAERAKKERSSERDREKPTR